MSINKVFVQYLADTKYNIEHNRSCCYDQQFWKPSSSGVQVCDLCITSFQEGLPCDPVVVSECKLVHQGKADRERTGSCAVEITHTFNYSTLEWQVVLGACNISTN